MAAFEPDSALVGEVRPSPNHGERAGGRHPDMLLLHYTGMPRTAEAVARLCDPGSGVSAHYVVEEDGRILQLVPEIRRAWHAGLGSWRGERDINSCAIGVEIANPGHEGGLPPYPPDQVEALLALARDIVGRWSIRPDRVLGHSDVAPLRKEDPGELFPWRRLHEAGIGHWVEPAPIVDGPSLRLGDEGPGVAKLQERLAACGYAAPGSGIYDTETAAVVRAFQRRFRPERVDGVADPSTITTLRRLLAAQRG